MKEKIYIETSIPSYISAEDNDNPVIYGHQIVSREWWANEKEKYELFISEAVITEISKGDNISAKKRLKLLENIPLLEYNEKVTQITEKYVSVLNLPDHLRVDMMHIGFAVYYEIDYLLTWNCSHINNAHMKRQFGKINVSLGYNSPVICTPEELYIYEGNNYAQ